MSEYSVKIPVEYTTEDIDDSVWGNGSLAYPWWNDLAPGGDDEPEVVVSGTFGCDGDDPKPFRITFHRWLNAAQDVIREYPRNAPYLLDKDVDADLGDLILQFAVAGKAVYG